MIVLVPVSRFRVAYEIARGRPYSKLERRVLEAVADGGATLRTLTTIFHVHERLLVESVVTLVNVGWVAVASGAEATFVLTVEGKAAINAGQDPVSVVVSQAKPQIVILERVTGQLARHADARSYRRDDLATVWQSAAFVRQRIFRNALDEAQVQKLLPRSQGEWIRWVGPITLASKNVHFVPADVNDETDQVRGLPSTWLESLSSHVVAAARHRRALDAAAEADRQGVSEGAKAPHRTSRRNRRSAFVSVSDRAAELPSQQAHVNLKLEDILVGTEAHTQALRGALGSAMANLLVASPSIDHSRLIEFLVDSATTLKRRVRIDVLPGETPDTLQHSEVLDSLNGFGYQTVGNQGRTFLRSGKQVTGSGASLILYDVAPGRLVAVIGNHDWLGAAATTTPVSVRLTEPSIVGILARVAASLWVSARPGPDVGAADRWRYLASAAEEHAAVENASVEDSEPEGTTSVEVIIDDEHNNSPRQHQHTVRVGRFSIETVSEQDSPKGLSLQLTGPGADLIATLLPDL